MTDYTKTIDTPVGRLTLVANDDGLVAVLWPDEAPGRVRLGPVVENANHPVLVEAERWGASHGETVKVTDPPVLFGPATSAT